MTGHAAGAVAVAAAAGGTVHGFIPDPAGAAGRVLWKAALLAIGATTLAAWWIAAAMVPARWGRILRPAAALAWGAYAVTGATAPPPAALGLVVLLTGSWVQWQGIGLEALHLTPNALTHVIEAVALVLLFLGARRLLARPEARLAAAGCGR